MGCKKRKDLGVQKQKQSHGKKLLKCLLCNCLLIGAVVAAVAYIGRPGKGE